MGVSPGVLQRASNDARKVVKSPPMDDDQPDTEVGAAPRDKTEVIAGPPADTSQHAWSDADDDSDNPCQPERHPWSLVTRQAAALITAGAAIATAVAVLGWIASTKIASRRRVRRRRPCLRHK